MSRVGNNPIQIPSGVEVTTDGSIVRIKGPKGGLEKELPPGITLRKEENVIYIERPSDSNQHRSLHGLTRTLVANMVHGVSIGFEKTLEIVGVGYRAALKGSNLEIQVGYSEIAAEIREIRKPEPYKGKGIKYAGEYIRRKVGKTAT